MEDQTTFIDENPQFSTPYADNQGLNRTNWAMAGDDTNAIDRWWHPQIAENEQFARENYFVDKENAFNEYMFNKANEYNSASAQMQRAIEAGINPNLMAQGIAGMGGNQAQPMQGSKGNSAMNTASTNPISDIENVADIFSKGVNGVNELGKILNFGAENKEQINLIKEEAKKTQEEGKFTNQQRRQLVNIGDILVENAKKEGQKIEADIEQIKRTCDVLEQTKYKTAAETNQIVAETGTEYEKQRSLELDNARKEFEKIFRDMFGVELTHSELSMLIEACMNGKGENIVKFFTNTIASLIKGAKDEIKDTFKIPRIRTKKTDEQKHKEKNEKAQRHTAQRIWTNNFELRKKYKGDFDEYLKDYMEEHKNDTMYKKDTRKRGWFGDLK